jgi:hypothetical protein
LLVYWVRLLARDRFTLVEEKYGARDAFVWMSRCAAVTACALPLVPGFFRVVGVPMPATGDGNSTPSVVWLTFIALWCLYVYFKCMLLRIVRAKCVLITAKCKLGETICS